MKIFTCGLWNLLPEEMISTDIASCIQDLVKRKIGFKLKTVPENTNPILVEDLLGAYNPWYNRVYLSNLNQDNWLVWVNTATKKLIYDPEATHISWHRDSVHYIGWQLLYVREWFEEIMSELRNWGFQDELFSPNKHWESLLVNRTAFRG